MDKKQYEELAYGQKKTLTTPSGYQVTIREQNGNDDDILSNRQTAQDMTNIDIFLASLIVDTNLPYATGGKLTKDSVKKMLIRDKYFILFSSRIHSMGQNVVFTFDWGKDNGGQAEYTEDLSIFVWDYSKPFPEKGDENYSPEMIKPYLKEPDPHQPIVMGLKSGKKVRFNLANGETEKELIKIDNPTRNAKFKARNLEQEIEGKYEKVSNFQFFSKKDMAELNAAIKELDPEFEGNTELQNPKTKETINYPIMAAESFFYPEEI